jgi:cysteine-rich repeat protein
VVSGEEVCDDGNIIDGDGCSTDCKSDEICGNHVVDKGESCDDGNTMLGDGCSADCKAEVCGNLTVDIQLGEVCDDGNTTSGDGCSPTCTSNEACGNGIIDIVDNDRPAGVLHEDCDPEKRFPLPAIDTAECDSDCTFAACGDGYTNTKYVPDLGIGLPEQCDSGPTNSPGCDSDCTFVKCGDGHANEAADEGCDLGTTDDAPTCDSDCTLPTCGDKHINPTFKPDGVAVEVCDTGEDSQTCDNDCTLPACGDGHTNANFTIQSPGADHQEECDGGKIINGTITPADSAFCDQDCTLVLCGDGHINDMAGEECEDNNNNDDDNNDDCPDGPGGTCKSADCGDGFIWNTQGGNEKCDNGTANSDTLPDACRTNCEKAFCGDGVIDTGENCDPNRKNSEGEPEDGCAASQTCNNCNCNG